jgi:predicted dienelactone hydrolase
MNIVHWRCSLADGEADSHAVGRETHRRWGAALAAVLLVALTACSGDDDSATKGGDTPTTTTAPLTERRPFQVGARTETVVDKSRKTPALPSHQLAEQPSRTIPLTVLYPTDVKQPPADSNGIADGGDNQPPPPPPDTKDAPVSPGKFPLLVFAHGWNGSGTSLARPARNWAAAGYVVALPTFPLSHQGIAESSDVVNQPGDVSFVIDTVLAEAKAEGSYLHDHVDTDRIAVGGHSLGSVTAFGFENTCCKDPRVKAIVAISGGPQPYSTGAYDKTFATPMLLIHGGKDPGVCPCISKAVFDTTPGRFSLLMLDNATHTSQFFGEDEKVMDEVMVAYLDQELGINPQAMDGLEAKVAASHRGSLRSKAK